MQTSKPKKRPKRKATDVLADRCGNVLYVKQSIWPDRSRAKRPVPAPRLWDDPLAWTDSDEPPDAIRYRAMILIRRTAAQWYIALVQAPDDIREQFDVINTATKARWHVLMEPKENEAETPLLCPANFGIGAIKSFMRAHQTALEWEFPDLSTARLIMAINAAKPYAGEITV